MRKIFVLTLIFMFLVSSGSFSPVLANTKPPTPTISINKTAYSVGEIVTFNFSYQNATGAALGIDHDNNNGSWYRYDTPSVTGKTTYSRSFDKPGTYAVYVSVSNTYGYSDSQKVTFKVTEKPPTGDKPNNQTDKSNRRVDRPINQTDKPNNQQPDRPSNQTDKPNQRGDKPNTQTDKPNNQQPNKSNNQTDKSIQRDDRPNTHTDKPNNQQPDKPNAQTDKTNNQQPDKPNNQTNKPSQRIDRPSTQTGKPNNQQIDRPSTNTDKSSQQIDRPTNQNDKPNTQTNAPVIRRNVEPKITANLPRTVFGEGETITVSWTTTGTVNNQFGITVRKEPYGPTTADDVEVKNFVSGNSYTLKTLPAGKYRVGITEWKGNAWGTASQLIYFEVKAKTPPSSANVLPSTDLPGKIIVGPTSPPIPKISVSKTTFSPGEVVTFNFSYQNATGAALGIDHDNNNGAWYRYDTPSVTGRTSYSRSFDKPGKYAVYISASNAHGYSDSQKVTFEVISSPPVDTTITPPTKPTISIDKTTFSAGESATFTFSYPQGTPGTRGPSTALFIEYDNNNNNGSWRNIESFSVSYDGKTSHSMKFINPGTYRAYIKTVNNGVYSDSDKITFKVIETLTAKINVSLPKTSYSEGEAITLSWSAEGGISNQFRVIVSKEPHTGADNVTANDYVGGRNSYTLKTLSAGKYRVKVTEVRGNALGVDSNTVDFEVIPKDSPPVTSKIIASLPKTVYNNENVTIFWTTEGVVNNQFNITVSKAPYTGADNVEVNNSVSGKSYTLKTLPAGKYRIKVTEVKGNSLGAASNTVDFEITTPFIDPKITLNLKNSYNEGEPIVLSWTTEGQVNNQFSVTVSKEPHTNANNVEVNNAVNGNSYTLKTLPAGKYRVRVSEVKGNALGVASRSIDFEVKPPTLLSKITASLPKTSYNEGEQINLSWTTEGQVNNQFNVTVSKEPHTGADNVEVNNSVSGNSYTLKTLSAGKYCVKITEVTNNALGVVSNIVEFEVKSKEPTTTPAKIIASLPKNVYDEGEKFTISWTTEGEVDNCFYVDFKTLVYEDYYKDYLPTSYVTVNSVSCSLKAGKYRAEVIEYNRATRAPGVVSQPIYIEIKAKEPINNSRKIVANLPKNIYKTGEKIILSWATEGVGSNDFKVFVEKEPYGTETKAYEISAKNENSCTINHYSKMNDGKYRAVVAESDGILTYGIASQPVYFEVKSSKIIVSLPKTVYNSSEPINVSWKTEGEVNNLFELSVGSQSKSTIISDKISGNSYALKVSNLGGDSYHLQVKELEGIGQNVVSESINFRVNGMGNTISETDSTAKANHPTSFPWTGYLTDNFSDGSLFGKKGDSILVKADKGSYYEVEWSSGRSGYLSYSAVSPPMTQQEDQRTGYLTVSSAKLLNTPNSYDPYVEGLERLENLEFLYIYHNDPVTIIGESGNYYKVNYKTYSGMNKEGYLPKSSIASSPAPYTPWTGRIKEFTNQDVIKTVTGLGLSDSRILNVGDSVKVIGEAGGLYYKIEENFGTDKRYLVFMPNVAKITPNDDVNITYIPWTGWIAEKWDNAATSFRIGDTVTVIGDTGNFYIIPVQHKSNIGIVERKYEVPHDYVIPFKSEPYKEWTGYLKEQYTLKQASVSGYGGIVENKVTVIGEIGKYYKVKCMAAIGTVLEGYVLKTDVISANNDSTSKTETLVTISNDIYSISTKLNPNMVLEVSGGETSTNDNVGVQIWENKGQNNQKWYVFHSGEKGYYTLRAAHSEKYLTAGTSANDVFQQTGVKKTGSSVVDAQKWKFVNAGENYMYLVPKSSENWPKRLDVQSGNKKNGTKVWLYDINDTDSQKWIFTKTTITETGTTVKGWVFKGQFFSTSVKTSIQDKAISSLKNTLSKEFADRLLTETVVYEAFKVCLKMPVNISSVLSPPTPIPSIDNYCKISAEEVAKGKNDKKIIEGQYAVDGLEFEYEEGNNRIRLTTFITDWDNNSGKKTYNIGILRITEEHEPGIFGGKWVMKEIEITYGIGATLVSS